MNCILAALAFIGLLLVGLVIVAGVGFWTIGSAALGIKTLSAHYKYSDASLMPTAETVDAEPQHCVSNDGDCRIVTVTVYREDKPAFHRALRQTIDQHGGSYAPGITAFITRCCRRNWPANCATSPMRHLSNG